MLAADGHPEGEHLVALLRFQQPAIQIQRHFRQVGIDLHLGDRLGPVHIPATAGVHKGFLSPVGLVQVEGVLLDLAVKGNKALLVFAVLSAFIPAVGGKVEHIPDVSGPQPGTVGDHFGDMFMEHALVGLGVVALFGMGGLVGRVGVGAVLAETDAAVGIFGVIVVKEFIVLVQVPQIPAEIEIVTVHIGDLQDGTGDFQHKDVGHGGGPGGVQLVGQIVEGAVVFQQLLVHRAGGGNLVGEAPHGDAGMVVVLDDELLHLAQGVGPAVMHVHGDVGDLGPDHQALLVAEVVEGLGVLIVGQPDGIGTHLEDQGQVLLHHLFGDGNAHPLAVLVTGDAPQRVGAPVEEETLLRVNLEFAAAEADRLAFAVVQRSGESVEVGVIQTVPQVGVFQREYRLGGAILHRGAGLLAVQGKTHGIGSRHESLHRHLAAAGGKVGDHRGHLDRHRAVFRHGKVGGGQNVQRHVPVEAAVEGEVRLLGIDGVVVAVVHRDGEGVAVL